MVGLPSTTNQSCLAINGTEKMGTSYLYYFYRYWADTLAFKFCQGTKQMSYTAKMVKKFPIYAPKEVNEQSRIASALSSIDNLLASLDKLIAKKQAIKQGAMQQLLTGKKRLKGFAEMWVEVKIGNVGSLLNTTINPQMTPNNLYHEYSMPAFDEGKHPIITQGQDMHSSRFAIKGEVLLVNKLNVRQKRIWYVHCCMQNSLCSMEFLPFISSKVDLKFLHYLLLTNKIVEDFKDMSKGTSNSQKRIVPNDFLEYKVVIPNNISEQRAIASVLTSMDNELAALTAKKQKYAAIKQGMMQQLLTGKIRLI